MPIFFNTANIAFTGEERSQKQKDAEKKVVTGGGAVAAANAARTKAAKSGLDIFSSSKSAANGIKAISEGTKLTTGTLNSSINLWTKVCNNVKSAKIAVINWGKKFTNSKLLKPLIESKAFCGFAAALGYGFGLVTLISGGAEIISTATNAINDFSNK